MTGEQVAVSSKPNEYIHAHVCVKYKLVDFFSFAVVVDFFAFQHYNSFIKYPFGIILFLCLLSRHHSLHTHASFEAKEEEPFKENNLSKVKTL